MCPAICQIQSSTYGLEVNIQEFLFFLKWQKEILAGVKNNRMKMRDISYNSQD